MDCDELCSIKISAEISSGRLRALPVVAFEHPVSRKINAVVANRNFLINCYHPFSKAESVFGSSVIIFCAVIPIFEYFSVAISPA